MLDAIIAMRNSISPVAGRLLSSYQRLKQVEKYYMIMKPKKLNSILKNIGIALSALRIQKGYDSIKDFAQAHDLPLIQYWRIEKGKANITIKSLMKLLSIHRLEPVEFFCRLNDYGDILKAPHHSENGFTS